MIGFIIKRLISMIPILIGISFLSFVIINLSPSDPAEVALRVNEIVPTETAIQQMREELNLNAPFFERYITWLKDSLQGNFGNSYVNKKPVADEIGQALPATIKLSVVALAITISVSVSVGVLCAVYEGSIIDKMIRSFVFLGTALKTGIHNVWVLLILVLKA